MSNNLTSTPSVAELNPTTFNAMIDLMLTASSTNKLLEAVVKAVEINVANLDESVESLAKSNDALLAEVRQTTRKKEKSIFTSTESDDPYADLRHNVDGNFIQVIFDIYSTLQTGYSALSRLAKGLIPGEVLVVGERLTAHPKTIEELSAFSVQYNMNRAAINDFASGTVLAERADHVVVEIGNKIVNILDRYYHTLLQRHEFDGVQVHGNPILTDIAMSVYANVDANGEVKDGKNPDEVSAYSLRKAMLVIEAVKFGPIGQIIDNPDTLMSIIRTGLKDLRDLGVKLADFAAPTAQRIRRLHPNTYREPKRIKDHVFEASLGYLSDLDPRNVVFRDKQQMATAEEQLEASFKNETLAEIVSRLKDPNCSPNDLVGYVLTRKAELHKYYQEVNSFYVCKIGTGNQFSGEAPGGLTVVPGVKPVVNIDDVVGSGFDQVKEFILQIREGAKWHDLFLATSPSKSGDKANALLIGPQGCHRKGQKVLMFDGTLIPVEQVNVGDRLMGPDSTPRIVHALHRGVQDMVEIIPTKGTPWVVNKDHMLTLVRTTWPKKVTEACRRSSTVDVPVSDYMGWSNYLKKEHRLFRTGVNFAPAQPLPLDPYFLGALLGDGSIVTYTALTTGDQELVQEVYAQAALFGLLVTPQPDPTSTVTRYFMSGTSHVLNPIMAILRDLGLGGKSTATKFVPHLYKTASREDRLRLLAGILDTDGSLGCNTFDFQNKSEDLANDVAFVARSLGFAAPSVRPFQRLDTKGVLRTYYRVKISGDVNEIPTRLPHKKAKVRKQVKNVLRTGFITKPLPPEEYFGFTLDGDHRYLLDDFTVTHNCGKSEVLRAMGGDRQNIGIYAQPSDFLTCWKGESEKNPKRLFEAALKLQKDSGKQVFILIDEVDTILNDDHARGGFGSTNLTTEFQQLMDGILRYPNIAVWSATNHPERIPMPMIRRFSKVAVVGELNQADRVKLLKHFTGFVPISHEFPEAAWEDAATLLEGAVGDTIRKVADHIWREKMSDLVRNHPRVAEKIIAKLTQDGTKKFQVTQLTKEMRADIHKDMRPFVEVTDKDLIASTATHLDNIAIRTEIATAVETYKRSKLFLAGIKATRAS